MRKMGYSIFVVSVPEVWKTAVITPVVVVVVVVLFFQ